MSVQSVYVCMCIQKLQSAYKELLPLEKDDLHSVADELQGQMTFCLSVVLRKKVCIRSSS